MQNKKYNPKISIKNKLWKITNKISHKAKAIFTKISERLIKYDLNKKFDSTGIFLCNINIFRITKIIVTCTFLFFFGYMVINANDFGDITIKKTSQTEIMNIKDQDDDLTSLQNVVLTDSDRPGRFTYIVQRGDTLISIAEDFGVTVNSIKNTNKITTNRVSVGQELDIAEIEGIIFTTTSDTSLASFAGKYGISVDDLKELNYISDENQVIKKGDEIFLPIQQDEAIKLGLIKEKKSDAEFKDFIKTNDKLQKEKETKPVSKTTKPSTSKPTVVKSTKKIGSVRSMSAKGRNSFGFALGNCTWYAAQMRPDIFVKGKSRPFGGNGKQRYANAKRAGLIVSKNPSVGAIVVISKGRGGYGHVGIVRGYDSDSITVESMNYRGKYIVSVDEIGYNGVVGYIPYQ